MEIRRHKEYFADKNESKFTGILRARRAFKTEKYLVIKHKFNLNTPAKSLTQHFMNIIDNHKSPGINFFDNVN